jgi:cellulose synthase operon protein YhjQ
MSQLICFCSPKGGVGKTSLSANVAGALARAGQRVLVIDLDVQNALRLHLGVRYSDQRGLAPCLMSGRSIAEGIQSGGPNLAVLPFGQATPEEFQALSQFMIENDRWLADTVAPFIARGFVVILDTPPGPSVFLEQTKPLPSLDIVVLQADATSVSLLQTVEQHSFLGYSPQNSRKTLRYAFNMIDMRRRLTRELVGLLNERLGHGIVGLINYDDSFGDAVAHQQLVVEHAPGSKAAHDIADLAAGVRELMHVGA